MAAATSSKTASTVKRGGLTAHDWKAIGAFALLALALGMYDSKDALYVVGVASVIVLVKNADSISEVLP